MKIAIKKIYCPTCQKLVSTTEETGANGVKITCAKCKNVLWVKEHLAWKNIRPE